MFVVICIKTQKTVEHDKALEEPAILSFWSTALDSSNVTQLLASLLVKTEVNSQETTPAVIACHCMINVFMLRA